MTINRICCECKKKYGEKDDGKERVIESHGYCDKCFPKITKNIDEFKKRKTDRQKLVEFCNRMMGCH